MQGGNVFYVDKILKKQSFPVLKYLVKWEGYDIKEATWEPIHNLKEVQHLIDEFEAKNSANISHIQKRRREATDEAQLSNEKCEMNSNSTAREITPQEVNNTNKSSIPSCPLEDIVKEYLDDDEFPEKVINAKQINEKVYCLVRLMERSDGIIPEDCYIPSSFLTENYPKILIDFYESKLKFV